MKLMPYKAINVSLALKRRLAVFRKGNGGFPATFVTSSLRSQCNKPQNQLE